MGCSNSLHQMEARPQWVRQSPIKGWKRHYRRQVQRPPLCLRRHQKAPLGGCGVSPLCTQHPPGDDKRAWRG